LPDNELTFFNNQGTLLTQMTIKNVTNKAHVAFFVSSEYSFINAILRSLLRLLTPSRSYPRTVSFLPCTSRSSKSVGSLMTNQ
jgi:hypothetical protein